MRSLILLLAFASSASPVDQAAIDAYALRSKTERPKAIASAKAELVATRRDNSLDKTAKHDAVAAKEAYLKRLEDKQAPFYPNADFELTDPKIGGMGFLDLDFRVDRVVSDSSAIIAYEWTHTYLTESQRRDDPVPRGLEAKSKLYLLTNVDAKPFASDSTYNRQGVFAVTGTRKIGADTYHVLEYVDLKPQEEKFMAR